MAGRMEQEAEKFDEENLFCNDKAQMDGERRKGNYDEKLHVSSPVSLLMDSSFTSPFSLPSIH